MYQACFANTSSRSLHLLCTVKNTDFFLNNFCYSGKAKSNFLNYFLERELGSRAGAHDGRLRELAPSPCELGQGPKKLKATYFKAKKPKAGVMPSLPWRKPSA
jgi:hypothetical protein